MNKLLAAAFLAWAGVAVATPVAAQQRMAPAITFRDLAQIVRPGLRVELTTVAGTEERGRVELVDDRLRIQTRDGLRDFSESDLREVRLRGDRLWNGAVLGVGIGFLAGGLAASGKCTESGEAGFCFIVGGAVGAPIGAIVGLIIDWAKPHRDVLYSRSPQVTGWTVGPIMGSATYGVRIIRHQF